MALKFSMLFNFFGSGFSESWYYGGTPPGAGASLYSGDFKELAGVRQRMCAKGVNLMGLRLSDTDNPRQTQVWVNDSPTKNDVLPDVPTNAWLALVRGVGNIGRRQLWLRGLPDVEIEFDPVTERFLPQGGLQKAMEAYQTILKAKPWSIRTTQPAKGAPSLQIITKIAPNVDYGGVTLIGTTAPATDNNIIVSGFRKPYGYLNGTYDGVSGWAQTTNSEIVLLKRPLSTNQAAGYPGGAKVRRQVLDLTRINTVDLEFPRERRIGRAFFVARGRR